MILLQVCNTWGSAEAPVVEPLSRRRRQAGVGTTATATTTAAPQPAEPYFSAETQFGLTIISQSMPNTAPVLTSETNITINEEDGKIFYNICKIFFYTRCKLAIDMLFFT